MTKRAPSPEDRFLVAAHQLFAERGFAGVSLADLAKELGCTKQAVLYHFKTKEALYGAVLAGLSARFEERLAIVRSGDHSAPERWKLFLATLHDHFQQTPDDARLVARELLDNSDRATASRKWYLKDFLDESVALLAELPAWSKRSVSERTAHVYQIIGAINYFAVSDATLAGIWGEERLANMKQVFLDTLTG